jgi:hypothetical protein
MDVRPFDDASKGLFTARDLRFTKRINPFVSTIGGHSVVPFNGLEHSQPDIRYITLLRDPVCRYVSQYQHWIEKKKIELTPEEFMAKEEFWNLQTRKIAGSVDLELAKSILQDRFAAVGVVERFNEFLLLLQRSSGLEKFDIRYRVLNTAASKKKTQCLLERHTDEVVLRNEVDAELYRFVQDYLLPEQIARYGDEFGTDLQVFAEHNAAGPKMMRRYLDYLMRKLYVEPVTGGLRTLFGKPYKGSY